MPRFDLPSYAANTRRKTKSNRLLGVKVSVR